MNEIVGLEVDVDEYSDQIIKRKKVELKIRIINRIDVNSLDETSHEAELVDFSRTTYKAITTRIYQCVLFCC